MLQSTTERNKNGPKQTERCPRFMDRMLNAVKMSVPPRATHIECKPYQNPNGLCWKDGKAEAEVDKELQGALKSWTRTKLEKPTSLFQNFLTVWYWHKDRYVDWRIDWESTNIPCSVCGQLASMVMPKNK